MSWTSTVLSGLTIVVTRPRYSWRSSPSARTVQSPARTRIASSIMGGLAAASYVNPRTAVSVDTDVRSRRPDALERPDRGGDRLEDIAGRLTRQLDHDVEVARDGVYLHDALRIVQRLTHVVGSSSRSIEHRIRVDHRLE